MRRREIMILFLLISPFIGFIGCNKVFFSGGVKNNYKPEKLYQKIAENEICYNSFLLKADGEIEMNGQKQSFQLFARIKKDSVIWVSVRMLGVEGMRVQCTTDSIYILDRINNQWSGDTYNQFNATFNIDFNYNIIQALLTNTFFFYPATQDTSKTLHDFNNCKDSVNYCISSGGYKRYQRYTSDTSEIRRNENKPGRYNPERNSSSDNENGKVPIFQVIKVYPEIYKIAYVLLDDFVHAQSVEVYYSHPRLFDTNYFPGEIQMWFETSEAEIHLTLSTERIETNTNQRYPFKIPSNYERMQ